MSEQTAAPLTYGDLFRKKHRKAKYDEVYCVIEGCDAEAVLLTQDTLCPFCTSCAEAFRMGQRAPGRELYDMEEEAEPEARRP